ncbi:hypothetical protein MUK42_37578 [Musa troglodytarum]|uniref:Uncharacterized protein n=1 Tax=Musa troglodytarum TaxID=320322 RepID=A0A9E7FPQ7_9LILI|nr:hypothetical protein MUK42_37578 [Musa troglodytarum]
MLLQQQDMEYNLKRRQRRLRNPLHRMEKRRKSQECQRSLRSWVEEERACSHEGLVLTWTRVRVWPLVTTLSSAHLKALWLFLSLSMATATSGDAAPSGFSLCDIPLCIVTNGWCPSHQHIRIQKRLCGMGMRGYVELTSAGLCDGLTPLLRRGTGCEG